MKRYALIGCEQPGSEFAVTLYDQRRQKTQRLLAIDVLLHRRLPRQIAPDEFRAIAWLAGASCGME